MLRLIWKVLAPRREEYAPGVRVGLDADLDGCFNVTEANSGTSPRDPSSTPANCDSDSDSDSDSD